MVNQTKTCNRLLFSPNRDCRSMLIAFSFDDEVYLPQPVNSESGISHQHKMYTCIESRTSS